MNRTNAQTSVPAHGPKLRRWVTLLAAALAVSAIGRKASAGVVNVPVSPAAQLSGIDFDNDGKVDVSFTASTTFTDQNHIFFTKTVTLNLAPSGVVGNEFDNTPNPSIPTESTDVPTLQFPFISVIGPSESFSTGTANSGLLFSFNSVQGGTFHGDGNFLPGAQALIGLSVVLGDGQTHYAWVNYNTNNVAGASVQTYSIAGYGYDTTPGAAIAAGAVPEPASLCVVAVGTMGVLSRRKRRK